MLMRTGIRDLPDGQLNVCDLPDKRAIHGRLGPFCQVIQSDLDSDKLLEGILLRLVTRLYRYGLGGKNFFYILGQAPASGLVLMAVDFL
jgi:hypothetical protein